MWASGLHSALWIAQESLHSLASSIRTQRLGPKDGEPKLDPSGWNDYDYIIFVANLPTRTRKDCGPSGTGWRGKKPPRASLPWCWQSPVRSRTWTASYAEQLSRSSSSTQIKARNMPTKNFWRSILWLLVKWEYQLCRIASYFPKAHLTAWQFTWDSCFLPQQFWAPERLRSKRAAFVISRTLQSETFNLQFWCIYTTQAPCAIHQVLTDSGCDKFKGPLPVVQTINLLWKHAWLLFHLSTCLSAPQSTILGPNPAGSNSMGGGAGAAGCDGSPPPLGIPGRPGQRQANTDAFPAARTYLHRQAWLPEFCQHWHQHPCQNTKWLSSLQSHDSSFHHKGTPTATYFL